MSTKLDEIERRARRVLDDVAAGIYNHHADTAMDILALVAVARAAERGIASGKWSEIGEALYPLLDPVGADHGEGGSL